MPRPDGSVFRFKARRALCAEKESIDPKEELSLFEHHCDALDDILRHSSTKDLRRIMIPFYFPRLVRLRLGDMLRYLVAHGERHLLQAQKAMTVIADGWPA
jgi:hypothetical protein